MNKHLLNSILIRIVIILMIALFAVILMSRMGNAFGT